MIRYGRPAAVRCQPSTGESPITAATCASISAESSSSSNSTQPNTPFHFRGELGTGFERNRRLSDPAGPDKRDQALRLDSLDNIIDERNSTDQRCEANRQIVFVGVERSNWREVTRPGLVDDDWLQQVYKAELAKRGHRHRSRYETCCCVGDQDLAAVRSGRHPSCPIHRQAEVVVVSLLSTPGVESHPNLQGVRSHSKPGELCLGSERPRPPQPDP